jgi:dUTP pyrophosphatase
MFISPQEIISKGIVTYKNQEIPAECIQPNGIDITIDVVFNSVFDKYPPLFCSKGSFKPTLSPLPKEEVTRYTEGWELKKGNAYNFDSDFFVKVPEGMVAWVIGRSSLNRYGYKVTSALYDSGYNGVIGATMYCFNDLRIEAGFRVGQIVFAKAESAHLYDGQYQTKV